MKTNYTKEQKRELVKKYYNGESVSGISLQISVPRSTFYIWINPYKVTGTASGLEVSLVDFAR